MLTCLLCQESIDVQKLNYTALSVQQFTIVASPLSALFNLIFERSMVILLQKFFNILITKQTQYFN